MNKIGTLTALCAVTVSACSVVPVTSMPVVNVRNQAPSVSVPDTASARPVVVLPVPIETAFLPEPTPVPTRRPQPVEIPEPTAEPVRIPEPTATPEPTPIASVAPPIEPVYTRNRTEATPAPIKVSTSKSPVVNMVSDSLVVNPCQSTSYFLTRYGQSIHRWQVPVTAGHQYKVTFKGNLQGGVITYVANHPMVGPELFDYDQREGLYRYSYYQAENFTAAEDGTWYLALNLETWRGDIAKGQFQVSSPDEPMAKCSASPNDDESIPPTPKQPVTPPPPVVEKVQFNGHTVEFPISQIKSTKEGSDPSAFMLVRSSQTCNSLGDVSVPKQAGVGVNHYPLPVALSGKTVYLNWASAAANSSLTWWMGAWMDNDGIASSVFQNMEKSTVCNGTWLRVQVP